MAPNPSRSSWFRPAAMTYLHQHARYTRVHNPLTGAKDLQGLPGLVAIAYQHETSRCGDPHLHTHVIVPTRQARADGQLVSIDSKSLYHEAKAAGIVYQTTLRHAWSRTSRSSRIVRQVEDEQVHADRSSPFFAALSQDNSTAGHIGVARALVEDPGLALWVVSEARKRQLLTEGEVPDLVERIGVAIREGERVVAVVITDLSKGV